MINIYEESPMGNREKMQSLLPLHYDELTKNKEIMILEPDYDKYQLLEDAGVLFGLYAYEDDKLVGYSLNIVSPHLHYKSVVMCSNDLLFLTPEKRQGRVGLMLIKETERVAKERGCNFMLWHAKTGTYLDKLLPRMGCSVQEIMYSKKI